MFYLHVIQNKSFDQERALYGSCGLNLLSCRFEGPADGESALKESRDLLVQDCCFDLRYPFWHDHNLTIQNTRLTENCRAALWYSSQISIEDSNFQGVKALRECSGISIKNATIDSTECLWFCDQIRVDHAAFSGEYFMLRSSRFEADHLELNGKYSFQYVQDAVIRDSVLNTKDAFWHSKNVTVYNSTVKGEYLGWYSENLRLVNCTIEGTQPLCYAKNLVLENCTMIGCDLSFENSEVQATIRGTVDSVKNPKCGSIAAAGYGEIILDQYQTEPDRCSIITLPKQETCSCGSCSCGR